MGDSVKDKGVWYFSDSNLHKSQVEELERTLNFIGGVQEKKHWQNSRMKSAIRSIRLWPPA
ncbi:hypothetical protein OFY05_23360 (plasmid) [Pseudocitrobacter faecalis]|nr:hypothetical protein OFY05_23360 [Pseudocitrobacter faecalis]